MSKKEMTFTVFLIHQLADEWNKPPEQVYEILDNGNIINEYIVPAYDVLHSMGSQYLVNDLTQMAKEKGLL